jgi:hypothetical protein
MPGAWIDYHERAPGWFDLDAGRRNDAHQEVVHWAIERAAVQHQLRLEFEHMGYRLRHVLPVLVAALPHDIPEQNAALRGIDKIFGSGRERSQEWPDRDRLNLWLA